MFAKPNISLMSPATIGALWMLFAACMLATISLLVRHISGELHPFEIAFFRNLGQFLFMVPWVVAAGLGVLRTKRVWAHVRRSGFGLCAMLTWFWVITQMPIAEATAISFSAPLFTTAGAALFLREKVGTRRWAATAVGFIGVLMIIRPGFQEIGLPQALALLSAILIAAAMLSNKSLVRTELPNVMVVWMGGLMSIFSLPPAMAVWEWPQGWVWAWLIALGLVATIAHLAINRAFASSDASFIAPFGFAQIPFVALVGYLIYSEMPDAWTWAGAFVIMASGVYTARREAKINRAATASPKSGVVGMSFEKDKQI